MLGSSLAQIARASVVGILVEAVRVGGLLGTLSFEARRIEALVGSAN